MKWTACRLTVGHGRTITVWRNAMTFYTTRASLALLNHGKVAELISEMYDTGEMSTENKPRGWARQTGWQSHGEWGMTSFCVRWPTHVRPSITTLISEISLSISYVKRNANRNRIAVKTGWNSINEQARISNMQSIFWHVIDRFPNLCIHRVAEKEATRPIYQIIKKCIQSY